MERGRSPIFESILSGRNLPIPFLYGISNRLLFPQLDPEQYLELIFRTDVPIIQLREKDLSRRELHEWVRRSVELARQCRKVFLVNSDLGLALEGGADGVHLTSQQSVQEAQSRLPPDSEFLVGKSVHSVEEAVEAAGLGADYLLLGPVFAPISKAAGTPALGLDRIEEAVQRARCPLVALGGIDEGNHRSVLQTGVAGVAGISLLAERVRRIIGH